MFYIPPMLEWKISSRVLPLQYTWHIARNASDSKTNLFVTVSDGRARGTGEAAPNIRYGETPASLEEAFHNASLPQDILAPVTFDTELDRCGLPNALRFAVESAYLHFLSASSGQPMHDILRLPLPSPVHTSYTIPILQPGTMQTFYDQHDLQRFRYIKLKVGKEGPLEAVKELLSFCHKPVMIDANEAFADAGACIMWLEKIRDDRILFVEQPLPAGNAGDAEVKRHSPFPVVADESITTDPDFDMLCRGFHGVNMKLMKAGGYLRGIAILEEARRRGLFGMIGCMVETTLGISSALRLSSLAQYIDLDSFLLLKDEPYGLVSENEGVLDLTLRS